MTTETIIALYDRNPNLTLRRLSRLSGWSVSELKTLLMEC
jgi:predicted HTH domain antitoxin